MNENNIFNSRNFGLAGAIILFIGCFLPFVSLPIVGSVTFFGNGEVQGIVIIAFAVLSLAFILFDANAGLFLTSIPVLSMLLVIIIDFKRSLSNASENLTSPLAKDIANAAAKAVQIQLGWAVMFIGACLLFTSSMIYALNEFKLHSADLNKRRNFFFEYGAILILATLLAGVIVYARTEKLF